MVRCAKLIDIKYENIILVIQLKVATALVN